MSKCCNKYSLIHTLFIFQRIESHSRVPPDDAGGGHSGLSKTMSQQPTASGDSQARSGLKENESTRSSAQQSSSRQDPRARGTDDDSDYQGLVGSYRGEEDGGILGLPSDSQTPLSYKEREGAWSSVQRSSSSPVPSGAFLPVCEIFLYANG